MASKAIETDTWNEYLLKTLKGSCFPCASTLDPQHNHRQFQIFEVLVGETIRLLYPNYSWHTTPVHKDGGIDFWGEHKGRPMPDPFSLPPLVIYGQVKREKEHYRREKLLSANEKMIRRYLETDLQKKSLHQLIHVISCDYPFPKDIPQQIAYKDNLVYVVTTIDAEDLFHIWAKNQDFLQRLLPPQPLSSQRNRFLNTIVSAFQDSPRPFEIKVSVPPRVFSGQLFEVTVVLTSTQSFPQQLDALWFPDENSSVYLVTPQGLLSGFAGYGYTIFLIQRYKLSLQCKIAAPGIHNLGTLRLRSNFGGRMDEVALGEVEVKQSYIPYYFELPNQTASRQLYCDLDNRQPTLSFYSVVGEGGIGKSTLLREISSYAINHGYHSIMVEHPCDMIDESYFWLELFQQLAGPPGAELSLCDAVAEALREALGPYYRDDWTNALQELFHSGSLKYSRELMECWLCMSILSSDHAPLFLWFSNMHWCSAGVIDLLWRYLKNLQKNRPFFNNKIVIIFEGRTEEALDIDKSIVIPYEWLRFQKRVVSQYC